MASLIVKYETKDGLFGSNTHQPYSSTYLLFLIDINKHYYFRELKNGV